MDILIKNFTVSFIQRGNTTEISNFFSEGDLLKFSAVGAEIDENLYTELCFLSDDSNARLYMDGLDGLPEEDLEIDDYGEAYLRPNKTIKLFYENYYPIGPGPKQLYVRTSMGSFFTLINVKSRILTETQLVKMKEELEKEYRGISLDIIRKNIRPGNPISQLVPPPLLLKFIIIEKYFQWVIASLNEIQTKPRHRVSKEYRRVPSSRVKVIDEQTIKNYIQRNSDTDTYLVPIRVIDYDLHENRWVTKITKVLINELRSFHSACDTSIKLLDYELAEIKRYNQNNAPSEIRQREHAKRDLNIYMVKAEQMQKAFSIIESTDWFRALEAVKSPLVYTPTLIKDPRYRVIYELYQHLKAGEFSAELQRQYAYQWKRTDKLYEMWGFFKLCNLLKDNLRFDTLVDFVPEFDAIIPMLPEGSRMRLVNGQFNIVITYNEKIPGFKEKSKKNEKPIFTVGEHNKPDIRMDIYYSGEYIGSLLMDLKYSPIKNVWDYQRHPRSRSMNQIISYSSQCRSRYLYGDIHNNDDIRTTMNVALETWVLYPYSAEHMAVTETRTPHIKLIKFCPEEDNNHLVNEIQKILDLAENRFHEYKNKMA